MNIGDRVKELRNKKGLTQTELANLLGYKSKSSVAHIENGRDIPRSMVVRLANVLNTTPTYLMGWEDEPKSAEDDSVDNGVNELIDKYDNIEPSTTKKFPVLGKIACGEPIYDEYIDTFIEASSNLKADFCLICKGDSMINARIYDGDIVFISASPQVHNGEIAAVVIGEEATLKRVYYYRDQNKLVLVAENPRFDPLVYTNEDLNQIRILGKAVAFMSNIK